MEKFLKIGAITLAGLIVVSCSSVNQGNNKSDKLSITNWQGTKVYDEQNKDLTSQFAGFISYAKYDANTNKYEFFDKKTKKGKDSGIYFLTNNGKKRILLSETNKYNAVVDITSLNNDIFTYKRAVKNKNKEMINIYVDHVPFAENLEFTDSLPIYSKYTGVVDNSEDGASILANTNWQGTYAFDENGNDVSKYNSNYLGLAKYDAKSNVYEFFKKTGEPRGDYGYYDVIRNNKVRVHYSLGYNYRAILELTELNKNKFTYKRKGKDKDGNDIMITVEHIPYDGELEFSEKAKNIQ